MRVPNAMTAKTKPGLPFDDLLREAQSETMQMLAARLGRTPRTLHRWKRNGVPVASADRAAIEIGSHPAIVWADKW